MEHTTGRRQLPAYAVLCIISLAAAVVLAAANMITRGPIARHQEAELQAALSKVLAAEKYEPVTLPEGSGVTGLYAAKNGDETVGWCVTASSTGYGGSVAVTLGVDKGGVVIGCVVGDLNFAETAGYGARAREDAFQDQFKGMSLAQGGSMDALSGATITSEAVRRAVDSAMRCVAEFGLGITPADPMMVFTQQ